MKNILVPVDFSDSTTQVVETASRITSAMGAHLTLLHVAPPEPEFIGYDTGPQSVRDGIARKLHQEHRELHDLATRLESGGVKVTALLVQGYAAEKILAEADRLGADLIVMGSHGRSALQHLLVGSVTDGVLRKSKCPVMVIPIARA